MSTIDGADDKTRKSHPIFSGFLRYFPDAALAVAELSRIANEKHNPGEPLHWSRGKSNDHADCLVRHQLDAGKWDTLNARGKEYKVRHSAEVAWRAMAQLQLEIEADQVPVASDEPVGVVATSAAFQGYGLGERRKKARRYRNFAEEALHQMRRAKVFEYWGRRSDDSSLTQDHLPTDARIGKSDRRIEIDTRATANLLADRRVFTNGRRSTDHKSWTTLPIAEYLK